MQLVKYNPTHELQELERDIDRLWEYGWSAPVHLADSTGVDMYEEDGRLVIELGLTNFKKEEVTVITKEGVLEIKGEHKEKEEKESKRRYLLCESSSQFFRRLTLPEGADGDKAEAELHEGKLKITMPVTTKALAKQIVIGERS